MCACIDWLIIDWFIDLFIDILIYLLIDILIVWYIYHEVKVTQKMAYGQDDSRGSKIMF